MIRLKRPGGFGRNQGYFVQCNQAECQYVEEIKAAEEARGRRAAEEAEQF
jgi:hypothetical protein